MAVIGNHGNGLLVIASQNPQHRISILTFECNAIAYVKLQHGVVRTQLMNQPEALHDAVIQIDEFGFGQLIYVDAIHIHLSGGQDSVELLLCGQSPHKAYRP
jgi:hypothetical protein